jgi:tripeptidyl-peptidase-1
VTAVGATQINPGSTSVYEPESACAAEEVFSGGGLSNMFSMPSLQEQAVSRYLDEHPPPYTANQFNNTGMVKMDFPWDLSQIPADAQAPDWEVRAYPRFVC